ncbi:hypothetical protein ACFQL7_20655 [Halocatena marina]|uniref:Uncharacterized protein n=1 Tax=Halocatena marina TaxID=2934937 RepID=A0ABD5YV81_9EURY|nr:hypothetical protein [Halocatena marina]
MSLTQNQEIAVDALPATSHELADVMGYQSTSGVYDLIQRIREKGYSVLQNQDGQYYVDDEEVVYVNDAKPGVAQGSTGEIRVPSGTKQAQTNKAKEYLSNLETELQGRLDGLSENSVPTPDPTPGNESMVFFRTDDHIGQMEHDQNGDKVFSSEIAKDYIRQYFGKGLRIKREREAMGTTFDEAYLVLDGDILTNEMTYQTQPHDIDLDLNEQMRAAADIYIEMIGQLSRQFPCVYVFTQHGNHGELRMGGQSSGANADDLLYTLLEITFRESSISNVHFVQNDATNETYFELRNHRGYIRHGEDSLEHIGTSAGKNRWKSWFINSLDSSPDGKPWDIAYRGHYHEVKIEPVAGRPVIMGGSLQPAGDYENSLGIANSRPGGIIHGVTDDEPLAWSEFVYFR